MVGFAKNNFMYKVLIFSILIFSFCGISHADETQKLYELYKSTSTPKLYKRHIKRILKRQERKAIIRKKVGEKRNRKKKSINVLKSVSQISTEVKNNTIQSADASSNLAKYIVFLIPLKKPIQHFI
ncbi:MAG: hypothetical protein U9Q34_06985 [Elusimicrobiota bacterium]|nr:hypothetical protein [Elusimicrobiota bacterium]